MGNARYFVRTSRNGFCVLPSLFTLWRCSAATRQPASKDRQAAVQEYPGSQELARESVESAMHLL